MRSIIRICSGDNCITIRTTFWAGWIFGRMRLIPQKATYSMFIEKWNWAASLLPMLPIQSVKEKDSVSFMREDQELPWVRRWISYPNYSGLTNWIAIKGSNDIHTNIMERLWSHFRRAISTTCLHEQLIDYFVGEFMGKKQLECMFPDCIPLVSMYKIENLQT